MTVSTFTIQETRFELAPVGTDGDAAELPVRSSPRPYAVDFAAGRPLVDAVEALLGRSGHPVVLADRRVLDEHLSGSPVLANVPTMAVAATEEFKSVEGALSVVDFMDAQRVSRSSLLVVIGGGIVQDVGAFAGCVYKRGVPWAYAPTTLLAQADSCIGAKSGLNFHGAKNLVGVFSAPRRILVHTGFLQSLAHDDLLSGLGEVFRLSIIGGLATLDAFADQLPEALTGNPEALDRLIRLALAVKRAVVEVDEFELDLRRSMNFGHSIGHALEALTDHAVPHGIAVAVGVLVESDISHRRGLLPEEQRRRLMDLGGAVIPTSVRQVLASVSFDDVLDILFRDKKTEGSVLKLVVPERIGAIRFVDLALEPATVPMLEESLGRVLDEL